MNPAVKTNKNITGIPIEEWEAQEIVLERTKELEDPQPEKQ